MKIRQTFKNSAIILGLGLFFVFSSNLINIKLSNFTNNMPLDINTKSEIQSLNQVQITGNRVGSKAPDFTVATTEAEAVSLSDFAKQKKPVVVYFMATWCPWCRKDYEALSKVYGEYEDKVAVLSISLDLSEDIFKLKEYKKKYPELQKMILAQGQEKILIDYSVTKTTTKYALDSNGTIIYYTIGAFSEEQLRALLDALKKS